MNIEEILLAQREFFKSGKTLDAQFRISALLSLKKAIKEREDKILDALGKDLSKSRFEGYMTEIGMVYSEIGYMIGNMAKLMRPKKAKTPISQFPAKSFSILCPYGTALIVSPWNYPFQLTMVPLIDCIAAGNTAIVKPSECSHETSKIIEEIISAAFAPEYVAFVGGGREENPHLFGGGHLRAIFR